MILYLSIPVIVCMALLIIWDTFDRRKRKIEKQELLQDADNIAWERYHKHPHIGDWTYNAEKRTEHSMMACQSIRAWEKKEDAIADYKKRSGDMPTLILLQYQVCVERRLIKWADRDVFDMEYDDINTRKWREIERIYDAS